VTARTLCSIPEVGRAARTAGSRTSIVWTTNTLRGQLNYYVEKRRDISSEWSGAEGDVEERARRIYAREVEPQVKDIQLLWDKLIYSAVGHVVLVGGATLGLALLGAPTLPLAPAMTLATITGGGVRDPQIPQPPEQAPVPSVHLVQARW
jgi:hypothetical protein